jgi:hypothetical protein
MNNVNEPFPQPILEDIRQNFGFMFDRGYEIVSTRYSSGRYGGDWEVLFESPDFSLRIVYGDEEGGPSYSFGSASTADMSVEALIYLLSGQKGIVKGIVYASDAKIANQLERYIDEIENRFRVDPSALEKEVRLAQKRLDELAQKSSKRLSLLISGIVVVVFFRLWNALLADIGFSSSSWIIRGVSLLLAIVSVYIIHRIMSKMWNATKSENATENAEVFTESKRWSKRSRIWLAIILFPIQWLFFAIIIGLALSSWSLDNRNGIYYSFATWGVSLLLALWIAVSIMKSDRAE